MVIIFFESESASVLKATIKMIDISSFQLRTGPMKIECDFNILDENLFRSCQNITKFWKISKMINEFTLTHLQPVFNPPKNNTDSSENSGEMLHAFWFRSALYTFYNMNSLGWEPRQKVDCISSGYFYPVFARLLTRDIPILDGWWEWE